jgi:hypothetical protein
MCPQCWILTSIVICDVSLCGLKNWFFNISEEYSNIYRTRCNVTQFILSGNCSTHFKWYLHPSSRVKTTVSTPSGVCHTVTAVCRYRGKVGTGLSVLHTQTSSNSSTIATDSNNGVTDNWCCRHSRLRSWWWVMVPPETFRVVSR